MLVMILTKARSREKGGALKKVPEVPVERAALGGSVVMAKEPAAQLALGETSFEILENFHPVSAF